MRLPCRRAIGLRPSRVHLESISINGPFHHLCACARADTWTAGVGACEYEAFLRNLFGSVTVKHAVRGPDGELTMVAFVWKDEMECVFDQAYAVEEEEKEEEKEEPDVTKPTKEKDYRVRVKKNGEAKSKRHKAASVIQSKHRHRKAMRERRKREKAVATIHKLAASGAPGTRGQLQYWALRKGLAPRSAEKITFDTLREEDKPAVGKLHGGNLPVGRLPEEKRDQHDEERHQQPSFPRTRRARVYACLTTIPPLSGSSPMVELADQAVAAQLPFSEASLRVQMRDEARDGGDHVLVLRGAACMAPCMPACRGATCMASIEPYFANHTAMNLNIRIGMHLRMSPRKRHVSTLLTPMNINIGRSMSPRQRHVSAGLSTCQEIHHGSPRNPIQDSSPALQLPQYESPPSPRSRLPLPPLPLLLSHEPSVPVNLKCLGSKQRLINVSTPTRAVEHWYKLRD